MKSPYEKSLSEIIWVSCLSEETIKQGGSSGKNGRPDVYDRSEWRPFLTAVIPSAVTTNAVLLLNLPQFTWIYLNLLEYT